MTRSECSPRHGSPLSCVMDVTVAGRAFSTAAARRKATLRPSSSLSSAFSARSPRASWDRKHRGSDRRHAAPALNATWGLCLQGDARWGRRCGSPAWFFSDRRSRGQKTAPPLLHQPAAPEGHRGIKQLNNLRPDSSSCLKSHITQKNTLIL